MTNETIKYFTCKVDVGKGYAFIMLNEQPEREYSKGMFFFVIGNYTSCILLPSLLLNKSVDTLVSEFLEKCKLHIITIFKDLQAPVPKKISFEKSNEEIAREVIVRWKQEEVVEALRIMNNEQLIEVFEKYSLKNKV